MPNTKSAKKRLRQNVARRNQNRVIKSVIRTNIRKVREAVDRGDVEQSESEFRETAKKLDQAVARNVIHRNKAARLKSRLQHHIKTAKQG